jgi:hypothetical protein
MTATTKSFIYGMLILMAISCNKDDDKGGVSQNFITNGDIENGRQDWNIGFSGQSIENNYMHGVSDEFASSPQSSLFISCETVKNKEAFTYFVQSFPASIFKKGDNLTLKVQVKGENLIGKGVSVALRGDKEGESWPVFFKSTEGFNLLVGTFPFKEVKVNLNSYLGDADYITVYLLLLSETTGKVYFDDISLTVE